MVLSDSALTQQKHPKMIVVAAFGHGGALVWLVAP
jgi:hypothetical protein